MTDKLTAKSDVIRELTMREAMSVPTLRGLASDDNPNVDERKAAKMMLAIGHFITVEKEVTP